MPSPSPTSRRASSSAAPRNLSAITRGDLQAGARFSSSSATSRSPHGRIDDHKENSTENGSDRGIQGRLSQNSRGTSKKAWVTHFSKPAGALTPSNRVLVERNSSCSPVRSGAAIGGYGEAGFGEKVRTTPPGPAIAREEASATPGRVKGVAELSKRIQQFLEEQEVVLGIKTGSSQEVSSSHASVTPYTSVTDPEPGQPLASSPYNPYKSPFFERPKFLRLNGSASTMDENEVVSASKDVFGTIVEQTTEELPLFEGDQVLATPLQHIQFSMNLSPISTEDEDMMHAEKNKGGLDETRDALKTEIQPLLGSYEDCLSEACGKLNQEFIIPCVAESTARKIFDNVGTQLRQSCLQEGDKEKELHGLAEEDDLIEAGSQSHPEGAARQSQIGGIVAPEVKEDGTGEAEDESQPGDRASQSQARDMKPPEIKEDEDMERQQQSTSNPMLKDENTAAEAECKMSMGASQSQARDMKRPEIKEDEDMEGQQQSASNPIVIDENTAAECKMLMESLTSDHMEDVDEEVCWREGAGRVVFYGALLAAFVVSVLVSSAGPGLLPSSLINNPVHLFWHSSKYHQQSMLLVSRMEGLWSTENIYTPAADVGVALGRGLEMFYFISRLSTQAMYDMKIFAQVTSSVLNDWRKVLLLHLPMGNHPRLDMGDEQRGRQFEWIQDYEFVEEEWLEDIPRSEYTDWELLYEYDLGAANQFILGAIPESMKNDLWRNFSHLSDCPEVKGLLEDLMKLKGGNTKEDRLEVLQYFWEYARFSASAHEALITSDDGHMGLQNDISHQESSSYLPDMDFSLEQQPNDVLDTKDGIHSYTSLKDEPDSLDLPGADPQEEQSAYELDTNISQMEDRQGSHGKHSMLKEPLVADDPFLDLPGAESSEEHLIDQQESKFDDQRINEEMEPPSVAPDVETQKEVIANVAASMDEQQSGIADVLTTETDEQQRGIADMPVSNVKLHIAQLATLASFVVVSIFILGHARRFRSAAKRTTSPVTTSVQFLRKSDQPQERLDGKRQQNMNEDNIHEVFMIEKSFTGTLEDKNEVTMIEELNDRFASVLQSPEPNRLLPLQARRDEDLLQSPVPTSATSPYGSFTTYKLMPKKEGQGVETKLTPVRRSSRIRNHVSMSPKTNAVKRIAISPP